MKIKKIKLHNFRCFKEYELGLSDRFTLLIGDNGSGKTAVLDALASTVSEFLEVINMFNPYNELAEKYSPLKTS